MSELEPKEQYHESVPSIHQWSETNGEIIEETFAAEAVAPDDQGLLHQWFRLRSRYKTAWLHDHERAMVEATQVAILIESGKNHHSFIYGLFPAYFQIVRGWEMYISPIHSWNHSLSRDRITIIREAAHLSPELWDLHDDILMLRGRYIAFADTAEERFIERYARDTLLNRSSRMSLPVVDALIRVTQDVVVAWKLDMAKQN